MFLLKDSSPFQSPFSNYMDEKLKQLAECFKDLLSPEAFCNLNMQDKGAKTEASHRDPLTAASAGNRDAHKSCAAVSCHLCCKIQ